MNYDCKYCRYAGSRNVHPYILVKDENFDRTMDVLEKAGYEVTE